MCTCARCLKSKFVASGGRGRRRGKWGEGGRGVVRRVRDQPGGGDRDWLGNPRVADEIHHAEKEDCTLFFVFRNVLLCALVFVVYMYGMATCTSSRCRRVYASRSRNSLFKCHDVEKPNSNYSEYCTPTWLSILRPLNGQEARPCVGPIFFKGPLDYMKLSQGTTHSTPSGRCTVRRSSPRAAGSARC